MFVDIVAVEMDDSSFPAKGKSMLMLLKSINSKGKIFAALQRSILTLIISEQRTIVIS